MSIDADTFDDAIEQAIAAPKIVSSGTRAITQHDPIALQNLRDRQSAAAASSSVGFGLRNVRLIPGGGG